MAPETALGVTKPRQAARKLGGRASASTPCPGSSTQVVATQRWVTELRASLNLLVEKCGSLEEANHDAAHTAALPLFRDLGHRHEELMGSVRPFLACTEMSGITSELGTSGLRLSVSGDSPQAASRTEPTPQATAAEAEAEFRRRCQELLPLPSDNSKTAGQEGAGVGDRAGLGFFSSLEAEAHHSKHPAVNVREGWENVEHVHQKQNGTASESRVQEAGAAVMSTDDRLNLRFHDVQAPADAPVPSSQPRSSESALRTCAQATPAAVPLPRLGPSHAEAPAMESTDVAAADASSVDRVDLIRNQAAALAASIGASLGNLLGSRSSHPSSPSASSVGTPAPSMVAGAMPSRGSQHSHTHFEFSHSHSHHPASLHQGEHAEHDIVGSSASSTYRALPDLSTQFHQHHSAQAWPPEFAMSSSAGEANHAISNVWARYHPSQNGGAASTWWDSQSWQATSAGRFSSEGFAASPGMPGVPTADTRWPQSMQSPPMIGHNAMAGPLPPDHMAAGPPMWLQSPGPWQSGGFQSPTPPYIGHR